ncbi:ATP-binding protein [Herbaspirillum huttiense]|uniref:ATP-binding protein n=2 Tax=Pseudomonadota TaxID=1224 RepID=UPI002E75E2A2|nr:ATP-binding protein [Herbaspirillum huttiense]MEE1637145.1 ATP-binding protein [Herbaspirillum huttiense NC40101]
MHHTHSCDAPRFIKPFHLAILVHYLKRQGANHLSLPEKIESYANTMNLWGALGLAAPKEITRIGGRYHPVEILENREEVENVANKLIALIGDICTNEATTDALCTMMRELLDNCYSHADVENGPSGYVCAQVWAGGKKAQIALVDTGIGIRTSLGLNATYMQRLSSENACEMATEYGVTGKPGKGHSGYGLAVARKLLEQNGGVLYVRSDSEAFLVNQGEILASNTKSRLHGTLLVIECDLDAVMNIRDVYDSFPLPDGMTDDDFDF